MVGNMQNAGLKRRRTLLTAKEALRMTLEYPVNEMVKEVSGVLDLVEKCASRGQGKCTADIKKFPDEVVAQVRKLGYSVEILRSVRVMEPGSPTEVLISVSWQDVREDDNGR